MSGRKMAGLRTWPCPSCGKQMIAKDAERKILHEAPLCAWFRDLAEGNGGEPTGAELLDPKTGQRVGTKGGTA